MMLTKQVSSGAFGAKATTKPVCPRVPGTAHIVPRPIPAARTSTVARAWTLGVDVHGNNTLTLGKTESEYASRRERLETIEALYNNMSLENTRKLLAPNFEARELDGVRAFNKTEYLAWLEDVLKAVPDFRWEASTSGAVDHDGYCLVTVKASGTHIGAPLTVPGLGTVKPRNLAFELAPETHKVLLRGSKVAAIVVVNRPGAGSVALFEKLSGTKVKVTSSIDALNVPPL